MIQSFGRWSRACSNLAAQVSRFMRRENRTEESLNKSIDNLNDRVSRLILDRLNYEAMAFRYYRATIACSKGMKRQAAKIKRLQSQIADIEFANKYPDGKPVEKEEVKND